LLDLKDSFHQIRVHEDSTKYFSFATPDGQFEYRKLPFGYSELTEFQKRILQVLDSLIREEKIIVYIDDILIAAETIEENISIIERTIILLKTHGFLLNDAKCQFLKEKIEFLGYVISDNKIDLSPRHTEAVQNFKRPKNVHEVQRFLGASYFRRFIKNFASKASPLYNLLRKDVKFNFNEHCKESFERLKNELVKEPVLALYSPSTETELHTDASNLGLGAILLQKQVNNTRRAEKSVGYLHRWH